MCVVSNIGDYWKGTNPWTDRVPTTSPTSIPSTTDFQNYFNGVSRAEFDKLKKEVEELKKLLEAAIKYDEATEQAHCETEDKVALLKNVAEALGIDLSEVFK